MKKRKYLLIFFLILCVGCYFFLNIQVSTRQGVNYKIREIKIPLYLKIIDFIDRHYNYEQLVKRIIQDERDDKEKVLKIFSWIRSNLKKQPQELPAIDDHVWHIIVRGYGVDDQFSDVFATLCNYAKINAFFAWAYTSDRSARISLAFVKIKGEWFIFDPYNGVYFIDSKGKLADILAIKRGTYQIKKQENSAKSMPDYTLYFDSIGDVNDVGLKREKIQSPWKRFLYEVQKWMKK